MKRIAAVLLGILLLASTTQAVGTAFALFIGDAVFSPPVLVTDTGIRVQYLILCYESTTRAKQTDVITVDIPDGSTIAQANTLYTDAIVAACATHNITVPRTRVFLPTFTQGQ